MTTPTPNGSTTASLPSLHLCRHGAGPAPELAAIRDGDAGLRRVATPFGPPGWLVTRYAEVREVLADAERFPSWSLPRLDDAGEDRPERPGGSQRAGSILMANPPEHTRLRRLLAGEMTPRAARRLEPRITEIVDEHLDAMADAGPPTDLVAAFAVPVPTMVTCELLGVPFADREAFLQRTVREFDVSVPFEERARTTAESRAYIGELVDRARADPGDDVIGTLVREHSDEVTREEITGLGSAVVLAGMDTTANMLALGTLALLGAPDQLARVRDDDAAVGPAVEELLRFLSVVNSGMARVAGRDTELAGVPIAAGDLVVVSLPGANRDPAIGDDTETLDITRRGVPHIAFGHGPHHCLGAPLARVEMAVAFPRLLRRFPTLALDVPAEHIEYRAPAVVHGILALPVTW